VTDEQILSRILTSEGSAFTHDPIDPGGATKFGVTQRTLSDWRGHAVSVDDVRDLTEEEARAIYQRLYLEPFSYLTDGALKAQVVDIAVNSGHGTARTLLGLARLQTERPVGVQLVIERLQHYARIVKAKPSQAKYLLGWTRRAVGFLSLLLLLALPVFAQQPEAGWGYAVPPVRGTSGRTYHHVAIADFPRTKHTHVCTEGVVTLKRREEDGDAHLRVSASRSVFIVAEAIPQIPVTLPRVGDRVEVCGISRYDKAHLWFEVHPVERIRVLPQAIGSSGTASPIQIIARQRFAFEPGAFRIRYIVERDPANRRLDVVFDGADYNNSFSWSLDGEDSPRTYERLYERIPAGTHVITACVWRSTGTSICATPEEVTVIGHSDR
jgi:hypothetical protein